MATNSKKASDETENISCEIQKTPGVCGGDARVGNTRITVATVVSYRDLGMSEEQMLENYPTLSQTGLSAAWQYYEQYQEEIDEQINYDEELDEQVTCDDE